MDNSCVTRVQIETAKDIKGGEIKKFITVYYASKFIQDSHVEYRDSFVIIPEKYFTYSINVLFLLKKNFITIHIDGIYFFKNGVLHRDNDLPAVIYTNRKDVILKYYKEGIQYFPEVSTNEKSIPLLPEEDHASPEFRNIVFDTNSEDKKEPKVLQSSENVEVF